MPDPAANRPILLLLEDEPALATAMALVLERDYEVDVANNADEARMLLDSRAYDLILSDHMLPGKQQGLDFLVKAMELQPKAKRILLTGYLNPDLLNRAAAIAQLSACLVKPIEMVRLLEELRRALNS